MNTHPLHQRALSRDPQHLSDDLRDSLHAALGDWASPEQHEQAGRILDAVDDGADTFAALRMTLEAYGPAVFGAILLFHQSARTSLMGAAEVLSSRRMLDELGLSVADLRWPAEVLHPFFVDDAAEWDPDELARFRARVGAFRSEHGTGSGSDLAA